MPKRIVLATSTSCLDFHNEAHDVKMIRIKLFVDGVMFHDGLDLDSPKLFKRLKEEKELLPQTSQPSVGEMIELFQGLLDEGYEEVFVVTISSLLSGSYNALLLASHEFLDKMKITIYDSKTVFYNEGYMALEASRMFKENKTSQEVINRCDQLKEQNTIFFTTDTLKFLIRNGRLTGAKAFFGRLLDIKPILEVKSQTGQIVSVQKERTVKKALKEVAIMAKNYINGRDASIRLVHADTVYVNELKEHLKNELGVDDVITLLASPVVVAHIGPNALGISIVIK